MTNTTAGGNRDSLSIADRVATGVELLDREKPGWDQRINLDTLRLSSCFSCVLGQIFDDYDAGLSALCLVYPDEQQHGFVRYPHESLGTYGELTAEWRRVITERREVAQ